jgi:hypothetical protein
MLFDCVINGLYMRVLKLTWKNLISLIFPQFYDVSVWSVRTVVSWHPDGDGAQSSGQELTNVQTRAASIGRTVKNNRPDARD